MRTILKQYITKYICNPGNVLEIGGGEYIRDLFTNAEDYCEVDSHRRVGVDFIAESTEIHKLFDYEPDTIICVDLFAHTNKYRKVIHAVRETLIPGGFMLVFLPQINDGSFVDAIFSGYEVFDLTKVDSTICGIAKKPYTIGYDTKIN